LKKVKLINFDVSYVNTEGSVSNKDIENIIAKKLSPIWDLVSNIAQKRKSRSKFRGLVPLFGFVKLFSIAIRIINFWNF
jgi:hypothetical protein